MTAERSKWGDEELDELFALVATEADQIKQLTGIAEKQTKILEFLMKPTARLVAMPWWRRFLG